MPRLIASLALVSLTVASTASATTFTFSGDPFAGTTALVTPGRQIVAGETFISFDPATDNFRLAIPFTGNTVHFANDVVGNLPTSNVNVIVLETFDNDANPATAFAAGNAADLIAARVTSPGAGFFIYFNSGLDLARLVYSTDLDDNTADLKVLFRMTNLAGAFGRATLPSFTAANFTLVDPVPEPSTMALTATGLIAAWRAARRRRAKRG